MRTEFIEELVAAARVDDSIMLVVGDLGFSVIEPFADEFPERFINAGVAEQNMMGVSAGLAAEGMHPFVYSIANFPTYRCAEQLRNDVAYHNLPVTVVAVGGGVGYGILGYSHHAIQDYALLRSLPNILIAAPGDAMEARACVRYLCSEPGPSYLRLRKSSENSGLHKNPPVVSPGQWVQPIEACPQSEDRSLLLSTGGGLAIAMQMLTQSEYKSFGIATLPLWGADARRMQYAQVKRYQTVVTVEDHLRAAGFGSWLLECAAESPECSASKIYICGFSDSVCGDVGTEADLCKHIDCSF